MIVCIAALFRRSLAQVFLWVYLPVMLLLPMYFNCKLPNLPPLNFSEAVLLPLGMALVVKLWPHWKFTLTDLWMSIFLVSSTVFYIQVHESTIGWFNLFHNVCQALVPYLLGKLLIEHADIRVATVRRIVSLSAACAIISTIEYVFGRNPFVSVWGHFFPDQPATWDTQFRWGFGRVAGPYGQSELAGIMFLTALVLAVWVGYSYPWREKFLGLQHPFRKRTILLTILLVTLFTTQARGPWLGCLLALPIAMLGRTRNLRRNALLLLLCCTTAGAMVYAKGSQYTETHTVAKTDEQQTAQYRRQLLDSYVPVAKAGGPWGWGEHFPIESAAASIDNEYLFVWLVQGWVGLASFILIAGDTLVRLILAIARSTGKRDRFFALSLFGIFAGILLTIGTVFLAQQPYQLFFLLVGWSQCLRTALPRKEERPLAFAHVLT